MTTATTFIPDIDFKNPLNRREGWRAVYRRGKDHKALTRFYLLTIDKTIRDRLRAAPRLSVRFVRIGGRKWDSDGLVASLKHCRTAVAHMFDREEEDRWFDWVEPQQEAGSGPGLRVELEAN